MRIGGSKIIPIDVRVIAATNKDLAKLVNENTFREDLYYRLKMGYIKLLPLRERKEDIIELIQYLIKIETREDIQMKDNVTEILLKYDWYGNVRELKNTISYMLAVKDNNVITLNDMPSSSFFQVREKGESIVSNNERNIVLSDEQIFIIKKINELCKLGELVGRERLAYETIGTKYNMTAYQMRTRLNRLELMGLIRKEKGKRGTVLSEVGRQMLMELLGRNNG